MTPKELDEVPPVKTGWDTVIPGAAPAQRRPPKNCSVGADSVVDAPKNKDCISDQIARVRDLVKCADDQSLKTEGFFFAYKKRWCEGKAIHIACQDEQGDHTIEHLLRLRVDVDEKCKYKSLGTDATALPIHLAIQSGNEASVQILLENKASVDAKTTRGGDPHYDPLHEAAYYAQGVLARFLLEKEADVNSRNIEKLTPLHVAAKMGHPEVAEILIRAYADINAEDVQNQTPLKLAVQSGIFPPQRLHLLATWSIKHILLVAEHCPSVAAEFMRDLNRDHDGTTARMGGRKSQDVEFLLQGQRPQVRDWIYLMDNAPDAGDCLLEVATVEPEEESIFYHPLPTQAILTDLRVEYTQDDIWRCDTEQDVQLIPAWHETLAPGSCRRSSTKALSSKASTIDMDGFYKWGQKKCKRHTCPGSSASVENPWSDLRGCSVRARGDRPFRHFP